MLTEIEYRYLRSEGRRFKITRDEAIVAFDAVGIPQIHTFLDFQTAFGLNGREPPDDLHPVVDYQRRSAANWRCSEIVGDSPWDDVMTENLEKLREREWQPKSLNSVRNRFRH